MGIIRKENTIPPTPPKATTAAEMRDLANQYINNNREEVIERIRDSASIGNFEHYIDSTSSSLIEYLVSLGYKVELEEKFKRTYSKVSWRE